MQALEHLETTMKIDSSYKLNIPLTGNRSSPTAGAEDGQATDSVSLSPTATALQGDTSPPVDLNRIQEIKDAISQGRFKINPEAIADGLIDAARDLINSQRQA